MGKNMGGRFSLNLYNIVGVANDMVSFTLRGCFLIAVSIKAVYIIIVNSLFFTCLFDFKVVFFVFSVIYVCMFE